MDPVPVGYSIPVQRSNPVALSRGGRPDHDVTYNVTSTDNPKYNLFLYKLPLVVI